MQKDIISINPPKFQGYDIDYQISNSSFVSNLFQLNGSRIFYRGYQDLAQFTGENITLNIAATKTAFPLNKGLIKARIQLI